ncbi:hypothetical protein HDV01_002235 [Terramyces sp. JEL0728]|nr:hypothetical protein HDV01_002235 [Terramyces sp. JEL0728]
MLFEVVGSVVGGLLLFALRTTAIEPPKDIYYIRKSFTAPNIFRIDTLNRKQEYETFEREKIRDYTEIEEKELEEILAKKEESLRSVEDTIDIDASEKSTVYTKHDETTADLLVADTGKQPEIAESAGNHIVTINDHIEPINSE